MPNRVIQLSGDNIFPNPILSLDEILNKSISVRSACIHGDLHLENVLVEHYSDIDLKENHIAHLIDFDNSRQDHVLRDILKLEAEIMARLLPDCLTEAGLPPETVYELYKTLHNVAMGENLKFPYKMLEKPFTMLVSLRRLAEYYLFSPNDWAEYYSGLIIYLIGVLKFKNLDKAPNAPLPKTVAFLGAATILSLLHDLDTNL